MHDHDVILPDVTHDVTLQYDVTYVVAEEAVHHPPISPGLSGEVSELEVEDLRVEIPEEPLLQLVQERRSLRLT